MMRMALRIQGLICQAFNNQTLIGKYNFRQLAFTTDTSENITDIRSLWGSITFNGCGTYGFSGQSVMNGSAPVGSNGSGTYAVTPAGIGALTNVQHTTLKPNGRWGLVSQPTPTLS